MHSFFAFLFLFILILFQFFVFFHRNISSIDLSMNKLTSEGMYVLTEGFRAGKNKIFFLIRIPIKVKEVSSTPTEVYSLY